MVQKGTLVSKKALSIGAILAKIRVMVDGSTDPRSTALGELKEAEEGEPFRILIGTILSHRTRDENTTKAADRLFARYKDAKSLANASESDVRERIRPAGFYNVKTRNIIGVARQLVDEFGGAVPDRMEDLLKLHSVGRKTANCVLVYAFNKPAIPVDTHVHRISNRLAVVSTKTPEQTEAELTEKIPKRYWLQLNELFVRFGQTTCKPVGPRCEICSLTEMCKYYKEVVRPKMKGKNQ